MALPLATTGSLSPAFASARLVGLAVKHPIYLCALRMIADHAEGTFELLRYNLGGNRPSQTDPLTLFFDRIHGQKLDDRLIKTGISPMAPPHLTMRFQSLPAILHMINQAPISEYSKGSRGLSVLLRVSGIFTGATTSPRSTLRQRPDRYTIRAGQNLPDKEFRYLRTVIVTADIHQGFGSELSPLTLTFWHWSRVTLYTSSCELAECYVFVKQSPGPFHCALQMLT
jgi:hypothetical protein